MTISNVSIFLKGTFCGNLLWQNRSSFSLRNKEKAIILVVEAQNLELILISYLEFGESLGLEFALFKGPRRAGRGQHFYGCTEVRELM